MYVADLETHITVSDLPILSEERMALFNSPNAMSVFVYPQEWLPEGRYLRVQDNRSKEFLGAVLLENEPAGINTHMMFLKRDRPKFTIATELAILYLIIQQQTPITKVLADHKLDYMHKFLISLGLRSYRANDQQIIYQTSRGWKPKAVKTFLTGVE